MNNIFTNSDGDREDRSIPRRMSATNFRCLPTAGKSSGRFIGMCFDPIVVKYALIVLLISPFSKLLAQYPCNASVPAYTVNLSGNPSGVWTSPNVARNGTCCGVSAPNRCIFFNLTLNPNAAGIRIDMIGADPAGSLFYKINCSGNFPGGSIKCITGAGPHLITFCKPGGNNNIYKITSISKPIFPKDDTVRIGCKRKFISYGVVNSSVTWQSIYPGALGQYNNYLDSANVASPTYSPGANAPAYIDYKVCGMPTATTCGYTVTVCDTVRVYNFAKLSLSVTPNPAIFCNVGPGSGVNLVGNVSGGAPTYSYVWKNSASVTVGTATNYFASAAGTYYLEVKDKFYDPAKCPSVYTSIAVSQGSLPTVNAGPSQKKCASNPAATLNGTVQNSPGGVWSGGMGTFNPGNNFLSTTYSPSASELAAGFVKLYLTTTIAGGCPNKKDSTIIYYSSPMTVSIPAATIACFNGTTTLNSNISGGTPPYYRQWNTGSTNPAIAAGQGNYSIIVYDSIGCSAGNNFNLLTPPPLALSFSVNNVTVNGGNDGSATVTASGGSPTYAVIWSPGAANTFAINNLVYGVYTATVTDSKGCKIISSTVVNEPRCLGLSATSSATNVSCYGFNNGVASVSVTGGTPTYIYSWNTNPVQTGSVATNLNAGVHTAVIKDANDCFLTVNFTTSEPQMLTNIMSHTNVTVMGGNNGAASTNPSGGTSPYSYLWNFGPTTPSVGNLSAGTYSVTITDSKGCVRNDNVNILQPVCSGLMINVYKNNVSCYGGSNGSALATVSGANGSYTINWSNGATGASVNNLAAGNYSVTVTNTNNCSQYLNFSITQPSQLSFGLLPTNVSCNGLANGSIDLTLAGGNYPYSFLWSNGSNSEDIANLGPGTYSVNISDAQGCSVAASANITQPAALAATYTVQNVSCIYGNNGAIGAIASGGVFPYTYTWSTGASTQSISGLSAGGYSVNIKDANNCVLGQPLFIPLSQPDSVLVGSYSLACSVPGSGQTQVTVVPEGGAPGSYQVSYNNGMTFQPAGVYTTTLANGVTYSVVLKDVNNCASLSTELISVPNEVMIDSVSFSKCYAQGSSTTNVTVYPSGGDNGPFSISFNNGASYLAAGVYSANLSIANTYIAKIKDNRGCLSATAQVVLPAAMSASAIVTSNYNGRNVSCFGSTDGSALASAAGGLGSYTYSWSTVPSQTTASASNLGAGTYTVFVKDINNCPATKTITLTQPSAVTASGVVTSNYNGQNISCFGYANGSASVTAGGGTGPFTYSWSTVPIQTTSIANNLSAGTYSVIVSDLNACTKVATVNLTQPSGSSSTISVISNYNGQQVSCYGASNGSAVVTALNGTAPFTYSWSTVPVQTGTLASNLSAGTYSVFVTDANGCSITNTLTITQPSQLSATAVPISDYNGNNVSCFGALDGIASVEASGGTGAYTYSWVVVPVQTSSIATGLGAGDYSVMVSDANGCNANTVVSLLSPPAISISIAALSDFNGYNIRCNGGEDGTIDISIAGGTAPYSFLWSNNAITQNISGLSAGNYSVVATDINGCTGNLSVVLSQPPQLAIAVDSLSQYNGYNLLCHGDSNGKIFVSASGGVGTYSFQWSNGSSSQNLIDVSAGNYTVFVVDQNNCTANMVTLLTQPAAVLVDAKIVSPRCNGFSDGSVVVTTTGGVVPFTYAWSNGATTKDLINIGAGIYSLVFTDKNGCSDSTIITVAQPQPLFLVKNIVKIKCHGDSSGSIALLVSGGTPPFNYLWSNGVGTASLGGLVGGAYFVNITDANGCVIKDTTRITEPPPLQLSLYSPLLPSGYNVSFMGASDGAIQLTVSGGDEPYSFLWSNGSTQKDLQNIAAGTYQVTVVDANGCEGQGKITLTEPSVLEMPTGFSPNSDGKNDFFVVRGIEAFPNNVLTIYNRWGNIVYKKDGYKNEWNGNSNNGNEIPDATYFVLLEINEGEKVLKGYLELRR